jgi:tetraacyldisaccharide 4'-kinase
MPERAARTLLTPAGLLYGLAMRLRNALYDQGLFREWRAPVPVVSVGNITAGGTGKTPLVDWIVKFYENRGIRPAIVSRGYGRRTKGALLVSDGTKLLLGSLDCGDEVAMLASRNPSTIVVVAEQRQEGVELLMREFAGRMPEVIVLDDAFQHRKIARDLDIVVINATEPFGGGAVLPAGRLREPLAGLGRADLFILSKIIDEGKAAAIAEELRSLGKPVVLSRIHPGTLEPAGSNDNIRRGEDPAAALRVLAFAGIGSPEGFVGSLEGIGAAVVSMKFFRDHQPYGRQSVREIVAEAGQLGLVPVTTEKDWFRIREDRELAGLLETAGCRYLPIEPELYEGRNLIEKRLLAILSMPPTP